MNNFYFMGIKHALYFEIFRRIISATRLFIPIKWRKILKWRFNCPQLRTSLALESDDEATNWRMCGVQDVKNLNALARQVFPLPRLFWKAVLTPPPQGDGSWHPSLWRLLPVLLWSVEPVLPQAKPGDEGDGRSGSRSSCYFLSEGLELVE